MDDYPTQSDNPRTDAIGRGDCLLHSRARPRDLFRRVPIGDGGKLVVRERQGTANAVPVRRLTQYLADNADVWFGKASEET